MSDGLRLVVVEVDEVRKLVATACMTALEMVRTRSPCEAGTLHSRSCLDDAVMSAHATE